MTPSLNISEKILNRLSTPEIETNYGKLFGIVARNKLYVLGLQVEINEEIDSSNYFPAEIDVCGIVNIGNGSYDEHEIKRRLNEIDVTDNPVFINYTTETGQVTASFYLSGRLEQTKFTTVSEQEILSKFLHVRLQGYLPLSCEVTCDAIKEAFLNLRKLVASGAIAVNFANTNIYIMGGNSESGTVGIGGNSTIGELCGEGNDLGEGSGRKKKSLQTAKIDVITATMLKRVTKDEGFGESKNHAPVCVLEKKQCITMTATIAIDALAVVHREVTIIGSYEILVESAIRHLKLIESALLHSLETLEGTISQPETFHFYPAECGHFVTKIYQKSHSEGDLLTERKRHHREFLLPLTRPLFRRANRFAFKTDNDTSSLLVNPHETLKPTDNGGKVSTVKGKYSYYHYCQNKMDDNGWGCAYRSLQTLASWFKHQGYTDKEVPTFADIQKCLVDIGDKPSSFVGSKQWIGSTEVNFVLNTLLGVTSKILYVSSGEEMAGKGQELLNHFDYHGSPVMIGGGVLAHTILGVDYNAQTGNLKFLILDPHYTGSEDLHTIQSKGWCGWKGVEFWDKSAYYNMCLPQVPAEV